MSTAYEDLMATLHALRLEVEKLPADTGVNPHARNPAHLTANGLTVVAYAAAEDFMRRRAHEVVCWLGKCGLPFDWLPKSLQSAILLGTLKGLHFSIDRTETSQRDVQIQLEGLLLAQTGEAEAFSPSKYFFGHSTSNLSAGLVRELVVAFGYPDADEAMQVVSDFLSATHLGGAMSLFRNMGQARHASAHGFDASYRRGVLIKDIITNVPLIAVCFDTCISQRALKIKDDFERGLVISFKPTEHLSTKAIIRVAQFDSTQGQWMEAIRGLHAKKSTKKEFSDRLDNFRAGISGKAETIIVKDDKSNITDWIQPVK